MRKIVWAVVVAVVVGLGVARVGAQSCGIPPIKPIPPIGCRDVVARCIVDSHGHVSWEWVCVR